MSEEEDISIEEVKHFVNEKRKVIRELTNEEKEKRLQNLARGRETVKRNRELKNLQEYEIEQNTSTDSDGLTYNSLKRKMNVRLKKLTYKFPALFSFKFNALALLN